MKALRWTAVGLTALVAGVLMFGAALGIGTAQAAPGDPPTPFETQLAKQLGISVEQLRAARKAAGNATVDQALAGGNLSPQQAAKLKDAIAQGKRPDGSGERRGRFRNVIGNLLDSAAKTIGISTDALKTSLKQGKSIAQVAAERGVSRDQLKVGITADVRSRLQTAVATGQITQAQMDKVLSGLATHLDKIIDRTGPKP